MVEAWEGLKYHDGLNGLKTLIVGESHYSPQPQSEGSDITKRVVRRYIDEGKIAFFGTISKIMGGDRHSKQERSDFWCAVGFMNFVDECLPEGGRPTPEQFRVSLPRFRDEVRRLKPDLVCFFSAASWEWRPWGRAPWEEAFGAEPKYITDSITRYDTDFGHPMIMARFNHPRGLGAPMDVWTAWYKTVLRTVAGQRG